MREAEALEKARKRAQEWANSQGEPFVVVRDATFTALTSHPGTYPFRVISEIGAERWGFDQMIERFEPVR